MVYELKSYLAKFAKDWKNVIDELSKREQQVYGQTYEPYKQTLEQLKNKVGTRYQQIFDQLLEQESQLKNTFGELKQATKSYFDNMKKVLQQKSAGSKAGVSADLSQKGLSSTIINNALGKIDNKYIEQLSNLEQNKVNTLTNLSNIYGNMLSVLQQNKQKLTDNEYQLLSNLAEKKKAIDEYLANLKTQRLTDKLKPLTQYLSNSFEALNEQQKTITKKHTTLGSYSTAKPAVKKKILWDYAIAQGITDIDDNKLQAALEKYPTDLAGALAYLKSGVGSGEKETYRPPIVAKDHNVSQRQSRPTTKKVDQQVSRPQTRPNKAPTNRQTVTQKQQQTKQLRLVTAVVYGNKYRNVWKRLNTSKKRELLRRLANNLKSKGYPTYQIKKWIREFYNAVNK